MNNKSFRDMMSSLIMPIENMIGLLDELENGELSDERKRMIVNCTNLKEGCFLIQ